MSLYSSPEAIALQMHIKGGTMAEDLSVSWVQAAARTRLKAVTAAQNGYYAAAQHLFSVAKSYAANAQPVVRNISDGRRNPQ